LYTFKHASLGASLGTPIIDISKMNSFYAKGPKIVLEEDLEPSSNCHQDLIKTKIV